MLSTVDFRLFLFLFHKLTNYTPILPPPPRRKPMWDQIEKEYGNKMVSFNPKEGVYVGATHLRQTIVLDYFLLEGGGGLIYRVIIIINIICFVWIWHKLTPNKGSTKYEVHCFLNQ